MSESSDSIAVLDVGHGNCAVVRSGTSLAIIDAPTKDPLLKYLDAQPDCEVSKVLVSHADQDHVAGLTALLTTNRYPVGAVYANPDPRTGRVWRHFRIALMLIGNDRLFPSLTSTTPGVIEHGNFTLQIVSPMSISALEGITTGSQSANTMSAVIRIVRRKRGQVLLTADMGSVTLDRLIDGRATMPDLSAQILVFPHHGGRVGGDPRRFAERLVRMVGPTRVVFSIGRKSRVKNPLPEIVNGVRSGAPNAHICCTQFSVHCLSVTEGFDSGNSCAGDIELIFPNDLRFPDGVMSPTVEEHKETIASRADKPTLCGHPGRVNLLKKQNP